jgi:hypothetical protein
LRALSVAILLCSISTIVQTIFQLASTVNGRRGGFNGYRLRNFWETHDISDLVGERPLVIMGDNPNKAIYRFPALRILNSKCPHGSMLRLLIQKFSDASSEEAAGLAEISTLLIRKDGVST